MFWRHVELTISIIYHFISYSLNEIHKSYKICIKLQLCYKIGEKYTVHIKNSPRSQSATVYGARQFTQEHFLDRDL